MGPTEGIEAKEERQQLLAEGYRPRIESGFLMSGPDEFWKQVE